MKILVSGASVAGPSVALWLGRAGHDVTVVEATNRVGGRVRSSADFVEGHVLPGLTRLSFGNRN